ncbi:Ig-like domain-containing protein [Neisseriaceae bacterium TC5R-5]|nr:Ig-like domain-containing protein [Neisseriaceae bacterium TC5R-5]
MENLSIRKYGNFFQRGLSRLYATVVFVLIGLGASLPAQADTYYQTSTTMQMDNYAPVTGRIYNLLGHVTINGAVFGPLTATGDVYFYDNGTFIGKATKGDYGWPAKLPYSFNKSGVHNLVAVYQATSTQGYYFYGSQSVPLQINVGAGSCFGPC